MAIPIVALQQPDADRSFEYYDEATLRLLGMDQASFEKTCERLSVFQFDSSCR